jgi:uncharacterized membrane protein (DUF373 family)
LIDPSDYVIFQAVFGMMFTVLIALEFKHSLIIIDTHTAAPALIAALAGASLALGIVYWLVRDQEWRALEHNQSGSTEIR